MKAVARWAIAALIGALAAGCVSRTGPPRAADEPSPSPETTSETTETTETTTTTTTTVAPLPPAADGTNAEACRDGDCEVAFTGEVNFIVNTNAVTVIVGGGSASLGFVLSGTVGSSTLSEPGSSVEWTDGTSGLTTTVTLKGIDETTAVISFDTA